MSRRRGGKNRNKNSSVKNVGIWPSENNIDFELNYTLYAACIIFVSITEKKKEKNDQAIDFHFN